MPISKLDACPFTVRTGYFYGYSCIPSIHLQIEDTHFVASRDQYTHTHTDIHTDTYGSHNNKTTTTTILILASLCGAPLGGLIFVRKFLAFMKPNFEFSFPLGYDTALLTIGSRRFEGTASLQNVDNQLSSDAVPDARKL